jgi:hypothetical protein
MPFKLWNVGEEVIAQDFNPAVAEQVIATFANAAARDVAILLPKVGQFAWLTDVATLTFWNGTAWAPASDAISGGLMVPHEAMHNLAVTAPGNVTSTSAVNWPTAAAGGPCQVIGFIKRRADTKVAIACGGAGYPVTAAGMGFRLTCRTNTGVSVNVDEWWTGGSIASPDHVYHGGAAVFTSLAAGTYNFTLQLLRTSGAGGAWQCDANDRWHLVCRETF